MNEIVKTAVEESKALVKPVYEDLAQTAVKEVGTTLGRTVHTLLFPVRGLCWGFEKIEEIVTSGLEKRLEKVSEDKRHTPEPEIAVPLMQALTYTAQNDTLREMYLNLLANAMNGDYDKVVHTSYVEIIKQMNRLDVLVFTKIAKENGYIKAITPNIALKGTDKVFSKALPMWFLGWVIEEFDIFDISACLVRLSRLGLIDLMYDRTAGSDNYDELESSDLIVSWVNAYRVKHDVELVSMKNVLFVNEFGQRFAEACL
jgi:hypothetical protein